jgi:isocitrate dehydrogenase (NAD+)
MAYKVTLIPGDGSGPEIVAEARRCIDATGVKIDWEIAEAGLEVFEKNGTPLPREVLDSIERNRVALKGPLTTPSGTGYRSVNVQLRQHFDLFACVRPCKTMKGLKGSDHKVNLVVIRENTEDLYAGIEYEEGEENTRELIATVQKQLEKQIPVDSGISLKPISRTATARITRFALGYAEERKRKKITVVTKANIMKFTDGLFYEVAKKIIKEESSFEFEHFLIDNACFQLVSASEQFDVVLTSNLYGDVISDLCAALVGGLGVAPSANIGKECAIFEAVHGSAPQFKGKNELNPCAVIFSGAMMLGYLGEKEASKKLRQAVEAVVGEGRYVTKDLNPESSVGTREMADRIIHYL